MINGTSTIISWASLINGLGHLWKTLTHILETITECTTKYRPTVNFLKFQHFLFSTKMLVIVAETHKLLVRIANREDPDQSLTASTEAAEAV